MATAAAADPWTDPSPHEGTCVDAGGARLHVLEWGRGDSTILLVPGWGLTAHVFDEIGAALAGWCRAIALTPRGFGESEAPEGSAYSIGTLVDDVAAVLDARGVERATLVGHSFAGSALLRLARHHPERVQGLVFLDAFPAYGALGGGLVEAREPVSPPPFTGEHSLERVRDYLTRYRYGSWNDALEADLRAKRLGPEAARRRDLTEAYLEDDEGPADLPGVCVPTLLIHAEPTVGSEYPWLESPSAEYERAQAYLDELVRPTLKRLCDAFVAGAPQTSVRAMPGSHYTFFTRPAETAEMIADFLEA